MTSWTRTTHWANAAASTTVTTKAAKMNAAASLSKHVTVSATAQADKMAELNSVICQFPDKLAVLLAELSCGTPFVLVRL